MNRVLVEEGSLDGVIQIEIPETKTIPAIQLSASSSAEETVNITAIPQIMLNIEDTGDGTSRHKTPYELKAGERIQSVDVIDPDEKIIGQCTSSSIFRIYADHEDGEQEKMAVILYTPIDIDEKEGITKETLAESSVFEDVDRTTENFAIVTNKVDGEYVLNIEHVVKTIGNPRYVQINVAQIGGLSLGEWDDEKEQFNEKTTVGNIADMNLIMDVNSPKAKGLSRWSIPYTFEGKSGLIHFWTAVPYVTGADNDTGIMAVFSSPNNQQSYQVAPMNINTENDITLQAYNIKGSQLLVLSALYTNKDNVFINAPIRNVIESQTYASLYGKEASFPVEIIVAGDDGVISRIQKNIVVQYTVLKRPPAIQLVSPMQIRALALGGKQLTEHGGFDSHLSPNDKARMQALTEKTIVFTQGINELLSVVSTLKNSVDEYRDNRGNPGETNS